MKGDIPENDLTGETWLDLARSVFPDLGDDMLSSYLWEYTNFDAFWQTDNPRAECLAQLTTARDAMAAGKYFSMEDGWRQPGEEQDSGPIDRSE